jgi:hypothetical protein
MGAEGRQGVVAVDFVIVAMDINGLALVPLAVASPGDLAGFRCGPEELVWRKLAGENLVR